jgi:hypothetical protein
LRTFEIGEEAPKPRRHVLLEQFPLGSLGCREAPAGECRHDLAQGRGVILRFVITFHPFNPERRKIIP